VLGGTVTDLDVDRVDEDRRVHPCNGREHQACISSTTAWVIRLIVSLEIDAPYTSAKCAEISPVVSPFAYSEIATASTSDSRR
jgi:hypothetical protein